MHSVHLTESPNGGGEVIHVMVTFYVTEKESYEHGLFINKQCTGCKQKQKWRLINVTYDPTYNINLNLNLKRKVVRV